MSATRGTPWAAWTPERASQAAARRAERRRAWLKRRAWLDSAAAWAPWVGGLALLAWMTLGGG